MDISCTTLSSWKSALSSYDISLESLYKPDLIPLDAFYRKELPLLIQQREPHPFVTQPELRRLLQWKLSRGKWRPRLLEFVSSLSETLVESASKRAFASLPDLTKAVSELTILKGVGPATASAVLAAYAPEVAPFMSDEAMVATLGNAKEYTLKKYISFAEILQKKAKELSTEKEAFTPSDVERALWSSAIASKLCPAPEENTDLIPKRSVKRKRS
ncbi:uncharacterized protein LOC110032029 isoform X1 [Phalaenopsis equestris]|uniref:uncharacterized protein LOC110032029 isoform X1 n=1 Tax=Phalaenopsis equestris TaxID=78828 RepID=UPI0009E1D33F|nr:uncharacterized protein LOC110032029 isoform X1 [Phalaenopsis equestris]